MNTQTKRQWRVDPQCASRVEADDDRRTIVAESMMVADAHLVAAAPELLDRLKELICWANIGLSANRNTRSLYEDCMAAIDKAEGIKREPHIELPAKCPTCSLARGHAGECADQKERGMRERKLDQHSTLTWPKGNPPKKFKTGDEITRPITDGQGLTLTFVGCKGVVRETFSDRSGAFIMRLDSVPVSVRRKPLSQSL